MKIAIASSGLGHVARGIEAWAADLARALSERGVDVRLFKGGGAAEAPYEQVISCWQRQAPNTQRLRHWLPRRASWRLGLGSTYGIEQATFALRLLGWLRRERIDILHVQDPQVARIVQAAGRVGLVPTRTILAHGTEEPVDFQRRITFLQHLAPWHLDEARAGGCWKPTWTALPNFIDTEKFRPGASAALRAEMGIPPDALVVLSCAAIKRHHKRIDWLLGEFAELLHRRPQTPAWLVVAGGREADTDALVSEGCARLGERVRFLVRYPRERMPELYRMADLFVLCSLKEMMPIALLEATASGLPCLVHAHPVLEWMTGAGGVVLDMAAPGVLAAALESLLDDPAQRQRLGRRARQHCQQEFSTERVIDRILDYYRCVLGCQSARRPEDVHAGEIPAPALIEAAR